MLKSTFFTSNLKTAFSPAGVLTPHDCPCRSTEPGGKRRVSDGEEAPAPSQYFQLSSQTEGKAEIT